MDWSSLLGPAVVAGAVSAVISGVSLLVNRSTTIRVNKEKIEADINLAERRFDFERNLAAQRFTYDRQQTIFRRRLELAEQVLADAYRFRDLMLYVRSSFSFPGEGETRKPSDTEPRALKKTKDNYFVPVERLQAASEFTSSMMARRYAARAHFGDAAEKAFTDFHSAMHKVQVSSGILIGMVGDNSGENRDLREELLRDIWEPMAKYAKKNEIGGIIEEGVRLIEGLCRPVLEESSSR